MKLTEIKKWLKENSFVLTLVGAILFVLNQSGFNVNLPQFYSSLDFDMKLVFLFAVNFLITVILFVYLLNRTSSKEGK